MTLPVALAVVVAAGGSLAAVAGVVYLVWLHRHCPISRVLARPGVTYQVGPVAHAVPALEFGREQTYLVEPRVLGRMRWLLQYTHRLLGAHDVPYWITNGTLLGALRHGGFTPWDDDIDVHIELRDLGRVRALKPQIERDGLVMLEARGGLKLAYGDRHRYPYVDLVVVERQGADLRLCFPLDRAGRPTFAKARQWPNECLPIGDVLPPALVAFEDFEVYAPRNARSAVRRIYGERALAEVRHRAWSRLENHFAMMTRFRLGLSRG